MNLREEKLSALTRQRARLEKARKNYAENSIDYRTISAVIKQHDKEIKKLLDQEGFLQQQNLKGLRKKKWKSTL